MSSKTLQPSLLKRSFISHRFCGHLQIFFRFYQAVFVIVVGACIGESVLPIAVGILMHSLGPTALPCVVLFSTIVFTVCYLVAHHLLTAECKFNMNLGRSIEFENGPSYNGSVLPPESPLYRDLTLVPLAQSMRNHRGYSAMDSLPDSDSRVNSFGIMMVEQS